MVFWMDVSGHVDECDGVRYEKVAKAAASIDRAVLVATDTVATCA